MNQRYDDNLVLGYVEGDLPADELARFEALLAEDAALRELTRGLLGDRAALRALPRETPPAHGLDDAMQTLERSMLLGDPRTELGAGDSGARRFRIGRVLAYSGLAAVLLITGGVFLNTLTDGDLLDEAARYADAGKWFEKASRHDQTRPMLADAPREAEPSPAPPVEDRLASAERAGARDAAAPLLGAESADAAKEMAPAIAAQPGNAGPEPAALAAGEEPGVESPATPATTLAVDPQPAGAMQSLALDTAASRSAPAGPDPAATLDRVVVVRRSTHRPSQVRVQVVTRDPGEAERDLIAWASRNRVEILDATEGDDSVYAGYGDKNEAAGQPAATMAQTGQSASHARRAAERPIVVQVRDEQIPQLLAVLNSRPGQRAGLVQSPEIVRRSSDTRSRARWFDAETASAAAAPPEPPTPAAPVPTTEFADATRRRDQQPIHPAQRALLTPPVQSYAAAGSTSASKPDAAEEARYQYQYSNAKLPGGALPEPADRQTAVQQRSMAAISVDTFEQLGEAALSKPQDRSSQGLYGVRLPLVNEPLPLQNAAVSPLVPVPLTLPIYITQAPAPPAGPEPAAPAADEGPGAADGER